MKAKNAKDVKKFQDIPNVGKKMAHDFHCLGLKSPEDLKQQEPFNLYNKMCKVSGVRQDPCVLDVYMAVIDFMNGAPARPWWYYTKIRKTEHPEYKDRREWLLLEPKELFDPTEFSPQAVVFGDPKDTLADMDMLG